MTKRQPTRQPSRRDRQPVAPLTIVAAAVACTVAIAACGSSSSPSGTATGASSQASGLAFAKCMRSHGVPNYPDTGNITPAMVQSPAFQSAATGCRKLRVGGGPPAGIPESVKLSLLRHARCMRAHGVPNYPDPRIPSHGPLLTGPPPGINTDAPAFQRAAAACGGD